MLNPDHPQWQEWVGVQLRLAEDQLNRLVKFGQAMREGDAPPEHAPVDCALMFRAIHEFCPTVDPEPLHAWEEAAATWSQVGRVPNNLTGILVRARATMLAIHSALQVAAAMKPKSGFLGLVVDEARGEIRRPGFNGGEPVRFQVESSEWHTFFVAFKAGESGATDAEWKSGYPGTWSARRKRKSDAGAELVRLNIEFEAGQLRLKAL